VRASQREDGLAVIESSGLPRRCVVANLALLRKSSGDMVGVGGTVEVRQVAGDASCAESGKHAAGMASRTGQRGVESSQRKCSLGVVEHCSCPGSRSMTDRAIGRKARSRMVRIIGLVVVGQVTGGAIFRRTGKAPIHVAL